jgi:catechol 2,3-dioxygenase-like lactoylglutathione lyase family enzyme
MNENTDLAIPILPCRSVSATTEFYRRLGFEGGAHGFDPDYAIFKRGTIELHFFAHAELDPDASWAGCYIPIGDVQSLYEASLASGLPTSGRPRLHPLGNSLDPVCWRSGFERSNFVVVTHGQARPAIRVDRWMRRHAAVHLDVLAGAWSRRRLVTRRVSFVPKIDEIHSSLRTERDSILYA